MVAVTKKQKILRDFIEEFIVANGYSPTYREIMRALGYKSVSTVAKHVDNLVAIGLLEKRDGEVRSLAVAQPDKPPQNSEPWWAHLEAEIERREKLPGDAATQEREILQKALEIVKN